MLQFSLSLPTAWVSLGVSYSLLMNIRDEGLRILALGTSATALGGNVRPKRFGRKSTTVEAVADELGSPHRTASAVGVW
jgi:hypothetical protein